MNDSAEATWATFAARDPSETIRFDNLETQPPQLEQLARHKQELQLGATLGVGGMGIVRVASQVRLGREVAVKSPLTQRSPRERLALLQEAWITGALEHPNIVPIHDIVFTGDQPHIVMKRIAGTLWADLLASPELLQQTHHVQDPLDWHLGVLLQVCRALEFAHSREILHRDLKPSNVMIGAYGEVYLLDWGIAVSLKPDPSGRFPQHRPGTVVGTPRYMAPEMARGWSPTVRTDVYLLGALLYRILTDHPPHQGEALEERFVEQICTFTASDVDAPAELLEVLTRAMHVEPERRYPSVSDFRHGLQSFLDHRASIEVADQAHQQLVKLQALLAHVEGTEAHRAAVYETYSACRFGFREALRTWPENPHAAEGLEDATRAMFLFEIDEQDPRSAAVHLSNLQTPDQALEDQLAALRAARAQEVARQQQLEREHNTTMGWRTRSVFAALIGIVWMFGPVVTRVIWGPLTMFSQSVYSSVVTALIFGLAFWAREAMSTTLLNRTLTTLLLVGAITPTTLDWYMWSQGYTTADSNKIKLLIDASYVLFAALLVDRRMLPSAFACWLGFAISPLLPGADRALLGLCALLVAGNAVIIWSWKRLNR